jgi:hypothetical protein
MGINGTPPPTDPEDTGGHIHSLTAKEQDELVLSIQSGDYDPHASHSMTAGVDTTTKWVRYRIPVGDSPDFVEVVNGKIFITLEGSGQVAIINEADILTEIAADRTYYQDWTIFIPMRTLPTWSVRVIHVGAKPSHMKVHPTMGVMGSIYVSLGQNHSSD